MNLYALAADTITAIHLGIVVFMILGLILVIVGWPLGWNWIRNPWLRWVHLGIMLYIMMNAARGELCFLTHWEHGLRVKAGQDPYDMETAGNVSFIGRMLHDILFVQNISQTALDRIYLLFGSLVLVGTFCVRPRWPAWWRDLRFRRQPTSARTG